MIIKTDLLFLLESGKRIGLFSGYYDMLENWAEIDTSYLDRQQLTELIRVVSKLPSLPFRIYPSDFGAIVAPAHGQGYIKKVDVTVNGQLMELYAVQRQTMPQTRWVNWDRMDDCSKISWGGLYPMLVVAVKAGLEAGKAGQNNIEGQLPEEWAWSYSIKNTGFGKAI